MTDESVLAEAAGPEAVAPDTGEDITHTEGQTEGQAAEGAEEDTGPAEEKKSAAKERREREKAALDRKISKLEAEKRENERKAQELEYRHQRILQAGQQEAPPSERDYPDPLEYVAAKAVWAAQQKAIERDAKETSEASAEMRRRAGELERMRQEAVRAGWHAQVNSAKERYADFEQVAFQAPISDELADLIAVSDLGADLAYHLGTDHKTAVKLSEIAKLNPVEAARALGRLEATLAAPQPRRTPTAPPPITPVRGRAAPAQSVDSMSPEEFAKWRASGGTFKLR